MTTIVLASDRSEASAAFAARLTSRGYDVVQADDAQEAIGIAFARHPDLVVVDLVSHGSTDCSSWAAARILKTHSRTTRVAVVLVESPGWSATTPGSVLGCCDVLLSRPSCTADVLVDAVENALERTSIRAGR